MRKKYESKYNYCFYNIRAFSIKLSSVSASDNNGTTLQHNDISPLDSNSEKIKLIDTDINQVNECDSNENIAVDDLNANQSTKDVNGSLVINQSENEINGNGSQINETNLNTLQGLINDAPNGSTLDLSHDFDTVSEKLIINITKSMTIDGHGHTIDLAGSSSHDHYFKVTDGSVTFKNIRFINGYNKDDDKGGAIFFKSTLSCILINCSFEKCWAESYGGAVYSVGNLHIYNSTFFNNHVENDGGAVYAEGNLIAENTIFENNSAEDCSGAVDVEGSNAELNSCTLKNNRAKDDGGALWIKGDLIANNTIFECNSAGDCSGAVDVEGSNAKFDGCTFRNNRAENDGGAIWADNKLTVNNSLFHHNIAKDCAGAIEVEGSDAAIYGCIFENNRAEDQGGVVWAKNNLIVKNTTFKDNTAAKAGGTLYVKGDLILINNPILFSVSEDKKPIICKGSLKINDSSAPNISFHS